MWLKSNTDKVVDIISKSNIADVQILAVEAAATLFPRDKAALLYSEGGFKLITEDEGTANKIIADLCELCSRLKYMESNHIICVIQKECAKLQVFQEGVNDLSEDGTDGEYGLGNKNRIVLNGFKASIIVDGGKNTLAHVTDISNISDEIQHFLIAVVFPTSLIKKTKWMCGLSVNDFVTRMSILIAIISVFVALFTSVYSPRYSVDYSNEHGYSTIKQSQFDSLMRWPMCYDSLVIIKRDTIVMIIHDTVYFAPKINPQKKKVNEQHKVKPISGK